MKRIAFLFTIILILSACGSPAPGNDASAPANTSAAPAGEIRTAPAVSGGTDQASAPTAGAALSTPIPPTATPPPVSRVIGPENFDQLSMIQQYQQKIDELVANQYGVQTGASRVDMWAYSPDGRYLAFGGCTSLSTATCYNPMIPGHVFLYILDAQTAELIYSLPESDIQITGLSFSPDGKWLAYAICPQRLLLLNMETLETERTFWSGTGCGSMPKTAISPDGKQVAMVVDTRLLVFDLATGKQVTEQRAQRHGSVLPKYSRDGTRLAVFYSENGQEIAIYDTGTWERTVRMRVSDGEVGPQSVDFSADGRWLVTADIGQNTEIMLWDAVTGERVTTLEEPLEWLAALSFTPDGRLLLAGGTAADFANNEIMSVWDLASLQRLGSVTGMWQPGRIMFANDGESFMASEFEGVTLWSLPNANLLATRQAVTSLFAALVAGDYQTAAGLYQPLEEQRTALQNQGLNPDDLPAALEALCARVPSPCMPIQKTLFSGLQAENDYLIIVSFSAPDGSAYVSFDGYATHWMYAALLPDGSGRVTYLPAFFFPPE